MQTCKNNQICIHSKEIDNGGWISGAKIKEWDSQMK